jgi:hypothetical protein
MSNFYVIETKTTMSAGGFACGPVPGNVGAEAHVRDEEGKEYYVSLVEVTGIPNFYKSQDDILNELVDPDVNDQDRIDELNKLEMDAGDYDSIFAKKDPKWFPLYKFLTYIVRADQEEFDKYNGAKIGKYLDEMDLPKSDVEE